MCGFSTRTKLIWGKAGFHTVQRRSSLHVHLNSVKEKRNQYQGGGTSRRRKQEGSNSISTCERSDCEVPGLFAF